jgi:O-glycosyl hydrolase
MSTGNGALTPSVVTRRLRSQGVGRASTYTRDNGETVVSIGTYEVDRCVAALAASGYTVVAQDSSSPQSRLVVALA